MLRTAKTRVAVRVLLPKACLDALEGVGSGEFHFWSGKGTKKSIVGDYQRAFKKLYELAKVENGHAHRWRDTFAVELLLARVPIADVATLLGHSSIKVTERHYSPWVVARQEQLDAPVAATLPPNQPHHTATTTSGHDDLNMEAGGVEPPSEKPCNTKPTCLSRSVGFAASAQNRQDALATSPMISPPHCGPKRDSQPTV